MWIFLNDSFLSIVDKAREPGCLVVRARREGDIEQVFPEAEVVQTEGNDYLFRAEIPRGRVAEVIAWRVGTIDYPNFKGSVRDGTRHDAYLGVWSSMHRYQRELKCKTSNSKARVYNIS